MHETDRHDYNPNSRRPNRLGSRLNNKLLFFPLLVFFDRWPYRIRGFLIIDWLDFSAWIDRQMDFNQRSPGFYLFNFFSRVLFNF